MKNLNLKGEEKMLAKELIEGNEREFKNNDQIILKSEKVGKNAVIDLVLEELENKDLRFRVTMYDVMGLSTNLEVAHEDFFDFGNEGLEKAKEYYIKSVEELLLDLEYMEQMI